MIGEISEVNFIASRTGADMYATIDASAGGKVVYSLAGEKCPIGDRSAPSVDLLMFERNRDIKENLSWSISKLRLEGVNLGGLNLGTKATTGAPKVTCTGKTQIQSGGATATVYQAVSEDGSARAWYSADGVVLKQTFRFLDMFDVYAVRAVPRHHNRGRQPAQSPQDED